MKKLLILFLVLVAGSALAQSVTTYTGVSNINFSADSTGFSPYPYAYINDNSDGDTARMVSPDSAEIVWPYPHRDSTGALTFDSSKCLVKLVIADLDSTYNPSGFVEWHDANGFFTAEGIKWGPSYATYDAPTGGGGGTGSGPNDDTVLVYDSAQTAVVEAAVFIVESTGGVEETDWLFTAATGRKVVKLAAASWVVRVNTPQYYQANQGQTITNAGDQLDTIFIYSFVPIALPGGDSCLVIIFTDSPYAQAEFTPNSMKFQNTQGTFLNARMQPVTADAAGIIQIALPVTDSTMQKTKWGIKVFSSDPGRPQMLDMSDYSVPAQSQDTVWVGDRD